MSFIQTSKFYNLVNHLETVNKFQSIGVSTVNSFLIEKSIFKYCYDYVLDNHKEHLFKNIYDYHTNLLLNSNIDFNKLALTIDLNIVAFLKPYELKPECYIEIQNKINKRNEKKNNMEYSDVYICKRCKQKKCISSVVVTRGLDENLTTIITCHNCGCVFTD